MLNVKILKTEQILKILKSSLNKSMVNTIVIINMCANLTEDSNCINKLEENIKLILMKILKDD